MRHAPHSGRPVSKSASPFGGRTFALVGAAMAGAALGAHLAARRAEARNPPRGRFMEIDGVRLHYAEVGRGPPVVLLHGNGATIEDFLASGLLARLAERHRVIAFDRPGFGYSERPRSRAWTPEAQAALLAQAARRLGVRRPVVLGHSWGTLVAFAWALDRPNDVAGLVLVSGYYFPTFRLDPLLVGASALPVIGDVIRYTISPLAARLLLPLGIRKIFRPQPTPPRFRAFPLEMALRPAQLRAASADGVRMIPAARRLSRRLSELRVPVALVAGTQDRLVTTARQTEALAGRLPQAELTLVPGAGHMVHYFETEAIAGAVERMAGREGLAAAA